MQHNESTKSIVKSRAIAFANQTQSIAGFVDQRSR
jgi:hypothetical protein